MDTDIGIKHDFLIKNHLKKSLNPLEKWTEKLKINEDVKSLNKLNCTELEKTLFNALYFSDRSTIAKVLTVLIENGDFTTTEKWSIIRELSGESFDTVKNITNLQ